MKYNPNSHTAPSAYNAILYSLPTLTAILISYNFLSFLHLKEAVLGLGLLLLALIAWRQPPIMPHPLRNALWPLWGLLGYQAFLHAWLHPVMDVVGWGETMLRLLLFLAVLHLCLPPRSIGFAIAWRRHCHIALISSAVICALLGLGQYFALLQFIFPVFPGYEQAVYSVFGNQDLFGAYLALGLVLLAESCCVPTPPDKPGHRLLLGGAALLLGWGLLLSQSRSAWLAAALGLVWLIYRHRNEIPWARILEATTLRWLFPVVGLLLLLAFSQFGALSERIAQTFSESDTGGRLRLWFWEGALHMIADHPLVGVGLGNFAYWSPQYLAEALHSPWLVESHMHNTIHTLHAHSDLLEFLAEFGLLAIPLLLAIGVALHRGKLLWRPVTVAFLALALINPLFRSIPHLLFLALYWLSNARQVETATDASKAPPSIGKANRYARALPVAAMALWIATHTIVVMIPSNRLTQAEDAHLAMLHTEAPDLAAPLAEEAREAYLRCIEWPVRRPQAWENFGKLELLLGDYQAAWTYLQAATKSLDSGSVHWHAAQAALHLGKVEAAQEHLLACLYRWPDHEAALQQLYMLSAPPETVEHRDP